jgi:hypothetical protein
MTDIPYPMISDDSIENRINQLLSYLNTMVDSINRMFENIDITNLNKTLAEKIKSGITEHQDTSGFTTSVKFEKEFKPYEKELNKTLDDSKDYVETVYASPTQTAIKVKEIESRFISKDYADDRWVKKGSALLPEQGTWAYIESQLARLSFIIDWL